MPAPQMIETPAMRRSALLAKMLEEQRQPTEIKGGYGELGARLLAQGITQWGANRAEKAAAEEAAAQRQARIQSQAEILGLGGGDNAPSPMAEALVPPPITNTQEPVQAAIAPAASVVGSALPPVGEAIPMADVPPVPQAPMPEPQGAPQQQGIFGLADNERRLAESFIAAGDEAGLAALVASVQSRNVRPDVRIAPDGTPYNASDPTTLSQRFRNVQNVNGFMQDLNDPDIVGRYLPDLQPGEEPLYDQRGNVVGVRNIDGAIQALSARESATANARNQSDAAFAGQISGARAAGEAPFEFITVPGPNGQNIVISKSQAVGGAFAGQTPSDAIREEGAARRDVARGDVTAQRSREAPERVRRYEEALALIPNAITGFGADARVAAARAAAAMGNQDARDAVAATEIYQNLIGRDIGPIVRDMVGSANISNSDRELATRIAGGDTNITPQALTRIVNYELSRQTGYLAASGQPISAAQARRLPRGTEFTGEDGQRYRVP
jgi:hypothetical protein